MCCARRALIVLLLAFKVARSDRVIQYYITFWLWTTKLCAWLCAQDDETEALLSADFEIGHYIRERIVPRAVLYFTGDALDDDDFEEEEEEEEEEEGDDDFDDSDDDQDPDFSPKQVRSDGGVILLLLRTFDDLL